MIQQLYNDTLEARKDANNLYVKYTRLAKKAVKENPKLRQGFTDKYPKIVVDASEAWYKKWREIDKLEDELCKMLVGKVFKLDNGMYLTAFCDSDNGWELVELEEYK